MYLPRNFKRLCLIALSVVATLFYSYAGNVTGIVIDAKDNSPLGQSTVKLLNARDSAFVKGTSSDLEGKFSFADVNVGRYLVQVSYIGYDTYNKRVRITAEAPNVNVGKLPVKENSIILQETTVVGVKTEIKVKEDTVEYNAGSYKTQPNAVVEDLLKRLPGVEVSTEGKITANGKEISKILIDGKEFFADDPKVASKNIPVDIVEKLQVVDRKSDLARTTGVDDGEDETVINLTVKKGMNNGWFGSVTGGYGTDSRYGFNGIVNRFWDGNQVTLLAGANNTNNMGFTDSNGNRFRRFGGANGIKSSQNVGLNFNIGKEEIIRLGGDIMYSHSQNDTESKKNRQYLFPDSVSYYNSTTTSQDKGHNLRADFRLKWNIDSANIFEFRPNFSFNINDSESSEISKTNAGDANNTPVNMSVNNDKSHGKSFEFGGELVYSHKFKKRAGRSFSLQLRYNLSNVQEDGTSNSINTYYLKPEAGDETDQINDNHTWSNNVRARVTWTEPLGNPKNTRYLVLSYQAEYKWNNADKLVYDNIKATAGEQNLSSQPITLISYDVAKALSTVWGPAVLLDAELAKTILETEYVFNPELSNQFRNNSFTQRVRAGFQQVRSKYNLEIGMQLAPSMSQSVNLIDDAKSIPTRWVWNISPYLRFKYKVSKTTSLQANYRARTSQPSMTQLQPVADMSNPLRVVIGNPNLDPTFTNMVDIRYNNFNQEAQRSIMVMARGELASNSIISKTAYDSQTGGQVSTYENVNGVWNVMGMGMISFPFRNKHWQFTNNTFVRYNVSKGYINETFNRSGAFSINESAGITFRTDAIEVEARPYYGLQLTTNTVPGQSTPNVHSYGGNVFLTYSLPFGLTFNTDLTYSATSGYSEGYNKNEWMWNASVSYGFLTGKAATISVKAYDILQQKQNVSRSITANYIQDSEYNSLTRYVMFTFAYRFNTFGGKTPASRNEDFNRSRYRRH
ncbi:MAG: outer membrane beta-barrel protein [Muribaculaceae bacterium]|nr:outer membrane beta-barrel protein [Muribaculaceae bacterium]